jgi:hypothetical protein
LNLSYSPGFTFYRRNDSFNQVDHNLEFDLKYRLSPHVTLSLGDAFQKTSNALNMVDQDSANSNAGLIQRPNDSIVAPISDHMSNFSNAEISYQFARNAMVGAKGTLSELWYPNRAAVPGLFDSSTRAAEAFYTHRLSGRHYVGGTYVFQKLFAHPSDAETQTQSMLLFYTLYLQPALSLSFFAGPEYSDTRSSGSSSRNWSPAAGASLGWQKANASFVASYARRITGGGGLGGAVRSISDDITVRNQVLSKFTSSM